MVLPISEEDLPILNPQELSKKFLLERKINIDAKLKEYEERLKNRLTHTYYDYSYIAHSDSPERKQTVFFAGSQSEKQLNANKIKNRDKFNEIFTKKDLPEDMIIFNQGKLLVGADGQRLPFQWDNEQDEWKESQDEFFYEKIGKDIIEKKSFKNYELKSIDVDKADIAGGNVYNNKIYKVILTNTDNTRLTALITGNDDDLVTYNIQRFLTLFKSIERRKKISTLLGFKSGMIFDGIVNQAEFKDSLQRMSDISFNHQYNFYQMTLANENEVDGVEFRTMPNDILATIRKLNNINAEKQLTLFNPDRKNAEQFRIIVQLESDEKAINKSVYNRYTRYPDSSIIVQMGLNDFEIVNGTKNLDRFLKRNKERGVLLELKGHGIQSIFGYRYPDSLAASLETMLTQLPERMTENYNKNLNSLSRFFYGKSVKDFKFSIEHINMGGCLLGKRATWFIEDIEKDVKKAVDTMSKEAAGFNQVTLTNPNTQDKKVIWASDTIDTEALKYAGLSFTEGLMYNLAKTKAVNQKPIVFEAYTTDTHTNPNPPLFEYFSSEGNFIEQKKYHKVFVLEANKLIQLEDADLTYEFHEFDKTKGLIKKDNPEPSDIGIWKYTIKENDRTRQLFKNLPEKYKTTPQKLFRGKAEANPFATELD